MTTIAAAVVGYLLGSVSPATWLARAFGVDLRATGSGNPGATNVGRALGRKWGVLVAVADVLKGFVPAMAFGAVSHRAGLVAGGAAVLGHVTSPWLRGRGGRGVATAAGAVLGSHPFWAPIVLLVWVVVLAGSRWVALSSVIAAASLIVCAVVSGSEVPDLLWTLVVAGVVIARHQPNFVRWWAARQLH